MKIEKYICDIKGCDNSADKIKETMQVIFTTEQTEGRPCAPYLCLEKIDMCIDHHQQIIDTKTYLTGVGAQGHNDYYLKANENE